MNTKLFFTLTALTLSIAASTALRAETSNVVIENAPAANVKNDPAAWDLLKAAHDSRQTFSRDFPGLTADVTVNDNGEIHEGALSYDKGGEVKSNIAGLSADAREWAEEQASSLIDHRIESDFAKGEGKNPITFGVDDHSPLGRAVRLNDRMQSSYRVRDNQVTEVTRTMSGQKFTITMMATTRTESGKYLPQQFLVTYFDKAGGVEHVDAYTDSFANQDGYWLPTSRRVVTTVNGGFTTRILTFHHIRIQKP
ncbi:hypothetical protein CCAX7_008160 [Capsulimonas corticalis]|uniref:Uncharacterized protein n=1 Tax=Capsulimonas corticalis TaxID=2219043 RepID=A0A402CTX9_9BACT|nr:DUF3386 family protein [Capsulimonas corticalis]BDI28765.1 hypothetical protein CCAX7_008160 [Capsulimonas corticalis]